MYLKVHKVRVCMLPRVSISKDHDHFQAQSDIQLLESQEITQ